MKAGAEFHGLNYSLSALLLKLFGEWVRYFVFKWYIVTALNTCEVFLGKSHQWKMTWEKVYLYFLQISNSLSISYKSSIIYLSTYLSIYLPTYLPTYLSMYECFSCMLICALHACLMSLEARVWCWIPGTRVIDGHELPCGFWVPCKSSQRS
jgi:hypothetical protein